MAGRSIGVIGVPTSAGAFAPGQERAPEALRAVGLVELLADGRAEVTDHGDRELWRWRPDRENPRAQNAPRVAEFVRDTARRVSEASGTGQLTLVLGGDCTVGIGTVAGHAAAAGRLGLVYFDLHADLNVPASVPEGALDWMGMAHMLSEPGAVDGIVTAGPRAPLLTAEQVLLFGWGPDQATPHERDVIQRRGIRTIPVGEVAVDPAAAANRATELMSGFDRLLVHFDVDVIDFTDVPLSENVGRNIGLSYDAAVSALYRLLADPRLVGLTITELNPSHAEEGAESIERLAADVAASLTQPLD